MVKIEILYITNNGIKGEKIVKQIKSFEHRSGWGAVNDTVTAVNNFTAELNQKGIENVEIQITSTGHGIVYTVIYEENN